MSREQLAKASTSSDLGWDENRQKDIDIVTALGVIQLRDSRLLTLGRLLIQLRGYAEVRSKTDLLARAATDRKLAGELLADMLKNARDFKKLTERQTGLLAQWAVHEWVYDRCHQCHGAGAIVREQGGALTCEACSGTGKHRYSDQERADSLGTQPANMVHYERALNAAVQLCGTSERIGVAAAQEYLGIYPLTTSPV